ncbi:hypothetical protein L1049_023166 [Liquidambar formosana]|uniref:Uncharacterized protein n=1 Tax=Liquidambar formosana TaxID=63359 RepID=A0AAP0RDL5_LIQFO
MENTKGKTVIHHDSYSIPQNTYHILICRTLYASVPSPASLDNYFRFPYSFLSLSLRTQISISLSLQCSRPCPSFDPDLAALRRSDLSDSDELVFAKHIATGVEVLDRFPAAGLLPVPVFVFERCCFIGVVMVTGSKLRN